MKGPWRAFSIKGPLKKIRGVNRLIKEVESEYSVFKTHNILAWFEKVNKITFFGVYSKIAEKRIFLIFIGLDLNLCKASQVRAFSPRARASLHGS